MEKQYFDTVDIHQLPNGEVIMVQGGHHSGTRRTWIIPVKGKRVQVRVSQAPDYRDAFETVEETEKRTQVCGRCGDEVDFDRSLDDWRCPCANASQAEEDMDPPAPPLRCCRKCDGEIIDGKCLCLTETVETEKPEPMAVEKGNRFTDGETVREVQKVFKKKLGTYVSSMLVRDERLVLSSSRSQHVDKFLDWVQDRVVVAPVEWGDLPGYILCPACTSKTSRCDNLDPVTLEVASVDYRCKNEACKVVTTGAEWLDGTERIKAASSVSA